MEYKIDSFDIIKVLGQGGSSKVLMARDALDNTYAIKALRKDKNYTYERGSKLLKKEHWITTKLESHPNILNSYLTNPDGNLVYRGKREEVMYNLIEYAENGTLSNYIRVTGPIEEELVWFMFYQMCDAIKFIHSKLIAHLDLKLENILLDKFFNIKLADLGVAHQVTRFNKNWEHRKGTLNYMAPEVNCLKKNEQYDAFKADIYSLGVWLYILLVGEFPDQQFISGINESTNDSEMEEIENPTNQDEKNSTKKWNSLSESAKSLIISMLSIKPDGRPSIEDVLNHEWLSKDFNDEILHDLYSEMLYRKNYIQQYTSRKNIR